MRSAAGLRRSISTARKRVSNYDSASRFARQDHDHRAIAADGGFA